MCFRSIYIASVACLSFSLTAYSKCNDLTNIGSNTGILGLLDSGDLVEVAVGNCSITPTFRWSVQLNENSDLEKRGSHRR